MDVSDLIFEIDHERTEPCPLVARERFTPNKENQIFLQQCREQGFEISTIVNIALSILKPKLTPSGSTWEGIRNVAEH